MPKLRFNKQTRQLETITPSARDVMLYPPAIMLYGAVVQTPNPSTQLPAIDVTAFTGGRSPANKLNDLTGQGRPGALVGEGGAITPADLDRAKDQCANLFVDTQLPPGPVDELGRPVDWVTWEWITQKVAGRPIAQKILDTLTQQYWERIRHQAQVILGSFAVQPKLTEASLDNKGGIVTQRGVVVHPKSTYTPALSPHQPGVNFAPTSVATVEGLPPVAEWTPALLEAWKEFERWASTPRHQEVNQQLMLIYLTKYANDHVTELARERLAPKQVPYYGSWNPQP